MSKKYGSAADIYSQIDEAPINRAQIVIIAICVLLNVLDVSTLVYELDEKKPGLLIPLI